MKKGTIRAIVLSVVFILALIVSGYFTSSKDADLTADMGTATLPTVSFTTSKQEVNLLAGHLREMDISAVRNTIIPLDEKGEIQVNIQKYGQRITKFHYEILTADGTEKLAEKTVEKVGETYSISAKEYLENNQEALLKICLNVGKSKSVYFYTRIVKGAESSLPECLDFVKTLHTNIIDRKNTDSIEKVMESNEQGDNTTFQHVTIHSDLKHITWGNLKPKVVGKVYWSIQETKPAYTSILLNYQVACAGDNNDEEIHNVKEFFRVRFLDGKYYLLTYDRTMEEIFDGTKRVLTGKGINLGLTTQNAQYKTNKVGDIVTFIQANELWSYNQEEGEFALVFSFADSEKEDIRHQYDAHSLKILSMEENGNVTFAVYGYMNRGKHEGESGAAIYYFKLAQNVVEEKAFIPSNQSYLAIEKELGKLAFYNNKEDVLYVMTSGELCKIDLETGEKSILLSGLQSEQYISSEDGRLIGYQKENQPSEAVVMNFATGKKQTISALEGEIIKPLGFVMGDFVYGVARTADAGHMTSGENVLGMYKLEIRDAKNKVVKTYQIDGNYLLGVKIEGNMITLERAILQNGSYTEIAKDYITNNEEKVNPISLQSYTTELKETQYRLLFEEGIENKKAKVLKPKQVLFEKDTTMAFGQDIVGEKYSVFGLGELTGVYDEAGEAVQVAKKIAGVVISPEQNYVWEEGNRVAWYRNFEMRAFHVNSGESALAACIRAVLAYEGESVDVASELASKTSLEVLDTYCGGEAVQFKDCSTADMRYLIDKGIPVIALTGNDSAVVLVGYDAKTVTYIDPMSGGAKTRNFSAVDAMMSGSGNTFFAYVK